MKLALPTLLSLPFMFSAGAAQQPAPQKTLAQVTFQFDRSGVDVPKFSLRVNEDGTAHYEAEQVVTNQAPSEVNAPPATQHIEREMSLTRTITKQIFAAAHELNGFNEPCASKLKNIADTGKKTLHYSGDGGEGTCVFNYSEDKRVATLTDSFLAIAATLDLGRKLDFDHRFDRLGLDEVTAQLEQAVGAGQAIEVGTIAPTLQSIARDSDILERVRARAVKLLQQAQSPF